MFPIALYEPDIFFTEQYAKLFEKTAFGGEHRIFRFTKNGAQVEYSFYLRPIPDTDYFDIASPYGYSGPWSDSSAPDLWESYLSEFHEWCLDHKIIAEFARLHPFLPVPLPGQIHKNDVVYVDLRQDEGAIWHNFDKGCRAAISKAIRLGMVVNESHDTHYFHGLYSDTMDRADASDKYFFEQAFVDQCLQLPETRLLGCGNPAYKTIAMALFLCLGKFCHYFLAGSDMHAREYGANNLLLYEAILTAKKEGYWYFNLGGGLKPDDSLFHFKKSFSSTTRPFYIYQKIHNQVVYDQLSKGRKTDYFPAYRG